MAEENPSEFRFESGETEPDSFYHEELKDLRVEKLGQRLTLLSILLPCLIAVALYVGYQNLSGRIGRSDSSGSLEIQRLTKEIEDLSKTFNEKLITFSTTLSTQDKDFGTSIEGRLLGINQSIDQLQKNFKTLDENLKRNFDKSQQLIEKLRTSKADKKNLALAVEKFNASIKPLQTELQKLKIIRKDLSGISADIKKLEGKLNTKLDVASAESEKIRAKNVQLENSLTKLSDQAVDKDALALEIFKIKKNVQSQISDAVSNLRQRLTAIQRQMDTISQAAVSQKQSMKSASQKVVPPSPGVPPKNGVSGSAPAKSTETITEKDLIE